MNADWAPGGPQPSDQTNWFGLWVCRKIGCYHPQTPSPFIITKLVSWYSFYRPTEGGRLSRPRHCSKGAQPTPKAVYRSDCRDKHDRPRWDSNLGPLAPQSGILPLSHHDLYSFAQSRRWCYPGELMKHNHCASMTVKVVRSAAQTQIYLFTIVI